MPIFNNQTTIDVTPTITAGAYSANDVVGGLITLNVASAGGGGSLRWLAVIDDDNKKTDLDFYFFTSTPLTIADNGAFAPLIADLKMLRRRVSVVTANYVTVNSNAYAVSDGINMDYAASVLYCYVVAVATPTFTATSDLTFRFGFAKD